MKNPFKTMRRKARVEREISQLSKVVAVNLAAHFRVAALSKSDKGIANAAVGTPLIVSLTTHSSRIHDVYLTIESLFSQSRKADRIVLWLSREEFSEADIPATLLMQMDRGLEVQFCDKDLGPYTKFYYSLQANPDALLLTVDDDIMYPVDMIDQLYRAYVKQPDRVHCHRAHLMKTSDNTLLPYKQWDFDTKVDEASVRVFPTGVGGVLYFPGCFDPEVFNQQAFLSLAPGADDVWLKAMTLKKGVLCQKVNDKRNWIDRFVQIYGSQVVKLKTQNKKRGGNDTKLKAVFEAYDLLSKL
jgi:hypothetical protein